MLNLSFRLLVRLPLIFRLGVTNSFLFWVKGAYRKKIICCLCFTSHCTFQVMQKWRKLKNKIFFPQESEKLDESRDEKPRICFMWVVEVWSGRVLLCVQPQYILHISDLWILMSHWQARCNGICAQLFGFIIRTVSKRDILQLNATQGTQSNGKTHRG
jgi:hypothetical protein